MEQNQQPQPPVFNQPQPAPQPAPQYQPRVTATPMMEPVMAVKTCFRKFFDFTGRARRSEYWWFVLFTIIVSSVFNYGGLLLPALSFVGLLCSLVFMVPQCSALTRRLHDRGHSGWWVLILVILYAIVFVSLIVMLLPAGTQLLEVTDPFEQMEMMTDAVKSNPVASTLMVCSALAATVVGFITFIFSVLDSQWGENKYGPSPKYQ